jgi:bacteriocin-type transport-associated protein
MRKVLFVIGKLSESDIDWLISVGARRVVPEGTVLIHQGRPADAVYIVLDGELSVSVTTPEGERRELARIGCGEIVGELSFLDARPPAATVAATQPATLLAIPRKVLSEKLARDTGFAARFYHALGILLAYRMRVSAAYREGAALSQEVVYDDELDPDLLDQVALASRRFDWMLKRLECAASI